MWDTLYTWPVCTVRPTFRTSSLGEIMGCYPKLGLVARLMLPICGYTQVRLTRGTPRVRSPCNRVQVPVQRSEHRCSRSGTDSLYSVGTEATEPHLNDKSSPSKTAADIISTLHSGLLSLNSDEQLSSDTEVTRWRELRTEDWCAGMGGGGIVPVAD